MRRGMWVSLLGIVIIALLSLGGVLAAGWSPVLGLDLQGGASVVLQPKNNVDGGVLDQAKEIIDRRVNALGVAEPDITRQGDSIIVQLPGVKDQDRALQIVGQTAELRFRPVLQALPGSESPPTTTSTSTTTTTRPGATTTTAPGATTTPTGSSTTVAASATTVPGATTTTVAPTTTTTTPDGLVPLTDRDDDRADAEVVLPYFDDNKELIRYRLGPTVITGKVIRTARAEVDPNSGAWYVSFETTGPGSREFDAMAAANIQKPVAIVLDGIVKSAPVIQQAQFNGQGQITGSFSEREAKDLALVLRYGSLPVELEQATVQTVSATLGKDSLNAGMLAGFIGLALVLAYIVFYYRALGLVVLLGLSVWGSLMWAVISWLGETRGLALTLAGATGIVVSIGVTADSYIVYFERLKDEVRSGKTIRSSVERGFSRAFRTILAADTSAFIGAFLLWWLTVGPVRGFAFFLGLSTILDIVVAFFFTRPLVALLARNRVFTEARWLGVARGLAARGAEATS
jgi:preprotein translocase subunit SecD